MNTVEVLCPESGQPITYTTKILSGGELHILTTECPAKNACTYDVPYGGHSELVAAALGR